MITDEINEILERADGYHGGYSFCQTEKLVKKLAHIVRQFAFQVADWKIAFGSDSVLEATRKFDAVTRERNDLAKEYHRFIPLTQSMVAYLSLPAHELQPYDIYSKEWKRTANEILVAFSENGASK